MKKLLLAAALTLSVITASCLGPNPTFNKVHHWNATVTDSRWLNEGIFLSFIIIPVYEVCYLGDIVIFNSIAFWKGEPLE